MPIIVASLAIGMGCLALVGCNRSEAPPLAAPQHEHHHLHALDVRHDHEHPDFTAGAHDHDHQHSIDRPDEESDP